MDLKNYFTTNEIKCKCCGGLPSNDYTEMYERLSKARIQANTLFIINRWYSCKKHNDEVKGVPSSLHLTAYAVDIRCTNSVERAKIVFSLICNGFNEIIIHKTFVHAGIDKKNTVLTLGMEM